MCFSPFAVTLHLSLFSGCPRCSEVPWHPRPPAACGWTLWVPLFCCRGICSGDGCLWVKGPPSTGSGGVWGSACLSQQGGPGQDDLQHHVHQGEPAPLPPGAWCVPAAQQARHLPRRTHFARRSVNPIPAAQNSALGHQLHPRWHRCSGWAVQMLACFFVSEPSSPPRLFSRQHHCNKHLPHSQKP